MNNGTEKKRQDEQDAELERSKVRCSLVLELGQGMIATLLTTFQTARGAIPARLNIARWLHHPEGPSYGLLSIPGEEHGGLIGEPFHPDGEFATATWCQAYAEDWRLDLIDALARLHGQELMLGIAASLDRDKPRFQLVGVDQRDHHLIVGH